MATALRITTAAQLAAAGDVGRCELVRGSLMMMSPAGGRHGRITQNLAIAIGAFVQQNNLGVTFTAETGFLIERNPDTVRAPDFAFVVRDRAAETDVPGYVPLAPDLVVEVISPNDKASEVRDKVGQWLSAGVKLVFVVDPPSKTITVHHPDGTAETLSEADEISAAGLLPGFSHPASKIFE